MSGVDLRALRLARGFSQERVAQLAGCSINMLQQLEHGYSPERMRTVFPRVLAVLHDDRGYRLWVNDESTVLVRLWDSGGMEVALSDHRDAIWGPPILVKPDELRAGSRPDGYEREGQEGGRVDVSV